MPSTTKDRILETTAELFRRHGYTGTGLKQIVAAANAPFGSLYHHFPGGKEELGEEVIRRSGQMYQELIEAILDASPDLATGVSNCFIGAAETLRQTDYADACPIETVALEVASTNESLRKATAGVFEGWISAGAERFAAAGLPAGEARELAIFMICALEGAFVLSRTLRDAEAVEIAGERITAALRTVLAAARSASSGE